MVRNLTFVGGLAAVLLLAPATARAQSQSVNAKPEKTPSQPYKVPRTVDGQPDLQGVWANNNATPLQRPKELEGRTTLTDQEVVALRRAAKDLFAGQSDAAFGEQVFDAALAKVKGTKSGFVSTDGKTGDYSSVWTVERVWNNRTSLIVDPADGRMPEMTAAAKAAQATRVSYDEGAKNGKRPDSYEDISLGVRCIFGSPRLGAGYNSYFQIMQSANAVSIQMEMAHESRIVHVDGTPHLPSAVKLWLGDSRGHWEGDTLVVDSTNYRAGSFMGYSSDKLHVVERFTRTSPDILEYRVTIEDPAVFAKPWTASIPLGHSKDAIYEYACHEGNYGLEGILAGARAEDAAEEQSAKKEVR